MSTSTPTVERQPMKHKTWIVTRIVREKFEVEHAENAEQAKDLAVNPFSVEVVRESARRWRAKNNEHKQSAN